MVERHAASGLLGRLLDKMAWSGALEDNQDASKGKGKDRSRRPAGEEPGVLRARGDHIGVLCGEVRTLGAELRLNTEHRAVDIFPRREFLLATLVESLPCQLLQ